MAGWQFQIQGLCESVEYLMRQECHYDVMFTFGQIPNQQNVRAHKLFLAARSSVFEDMFYGGHSPEVGNEIQITDERVNIRIFRIVIKFIYTDKLESNRLNELLQIYYIAYQYKIYKLMTICRDQIIPRIDVNNVCIVFQHSFEFNDEVMKNSCRIVISQHTESVLQSENFIQISQDTVINILKLNEMNIPSESVLFEAAIRWAKEQIAKANQDSSSSRVIRVRMNPLLSHIRFLTMTIEQIFLGPETSGIFKEGEIMKICKNIANYGSTALPDWCCTNKLRRRPPPIS
ncbi:BTB/POZ domain-containing protein 1-like [Centruroides vittatus]|uniref:BTB/POZ domain-containing protein 1-like n=1 Tax=Centruroides vittatus TaxID=120091 RepID=UPI0035101169